MILWADLAGVDEALARIVLAVARSIAPGLEALEGEQRKDALAILKGVATSAPIPQGIASQRIGPASVAYREVKSRFSPDDRAALRGLVADSLAVDQAGLPVGSFPAPSRVVHRMWPEE